MSAPALSVLTRRLEGVADPLAVFAAAAGGRASAALFETADAGAQESAQSLVFLDPWLSLTARSGSVTVASRRDAARPLLDAIARRREHALEARDPDALSLRYDPPGTSRQDERSRLTEPSVLDPLRDVTTALPIGDAGTAAFAYGCFAYDLVGSFEVLPEPRDASDGYPDYAFHLAGAVIRIDHRHAATTLAVLAPRGDEVTARRRLGELADLCQSAGRFDVPPPPSVGARVTLSDRAYGSVVERARERIAAGDVYQVVPSRAWEAPCANPLEAYARLRASNPSPYMFCVRDEHGTLFGASPESALKVEAATRRVEVHPIAGTRPRGRDAAGRPDPERDARLELELRLSEKEIAEHVMLVDLARNDIARIAVPGSRRVSELMHVERYSHVMHLVSRVGGELAAGLDALHAYRASLNMGTLTGAPKVRAAGLLREYEPVRRGPYGGAVGYLTAAGDLDSAIVIRSALVRDGVARVQAGAGVVADSDPLAEADETRRKAQAVLSALGASEENDDE